MRRSGVSATVRALPMAVLLVAMVAACGADDGAGSSGTQTIDPDTTGDVTIAPDTTPPDATPPDPVPSDTTRPDTTQGGTDPPGTALPAPEFITEADEGRFTLEPDGPVSLRLSSDWAWDAPVVDGTGVVLTPVDYLVDPGYVEWLVEPVAAGTATLTVAGTPNCGDEAACAPRTVSFQFDVPG